MAFYRSSISGTATVYSQDGYYAEVRAGGITWATIPASLGAVSFFTVGTIDTAFDPRNYTPTTTSDNARITGYTWSVTYYPDPPATFSVACYTDGHGTLTASPSSGTSGTVITLNPVPSSGYVFDHYVANPSTSISNNQFTLTQNVTINCFFRKVYTQVTAGNYIKATDRSQTGTATTAGSTLSDSHFSNGESAAASTFNSRVLS